MEEMFERSNENGDSYFEDTQQQMYYDDKNAVDKSVFFSLSVFQVTVCMIMSAIVFLMSFFGSFREKMIEAIDYFQSFELTGSDIKKEIDAMRDFLGDAEI